MKEEEIPVGGEEAVERDHRAARGTLEHAARGGVPVTLGENSPSALAQVIHVRLKSLFEPWVVGQEGGGGAIGRSAFASIEDTRQGVDLIVTRVTGVAARAWG